MSVNLTLAQDIIKKHFIIEQFSLQVMDMYQHNYRLEQSSNVWMVEIYFQVILFHYNFKHSRKIFLLLAKNETSGDDRVEKKRSY